MRLSRLIKHLKGCRVNYHLADFQVKGISCNSKNISDGFIFVAIKGVNADGAAFIDEALKNGAGAVVIEAKELTAGCLYKVPVIAVDDARKALAILAAEFYGNPAQKIKIVGITGTNGKTTISYLLEALLKQSGNSPAVIGTVNYRFNDKVIEAGNTTPGPLQLQSMFARMLKEGIEYVLMEVSSHALHQNRTAGIIFDSAVFTNLTQDHLDYHGTLEDYFQAKGLLFRDLPKNAFAVVNLDDQYGRRLAEMTAARVVSYALDTPADVTAKDIKYGTDRTKFTLAGPCGCLKLDIPLIGRHNVYNVLAASAWAITAGLKPDAIKQALESFSSVPGRLEPVETGRGFSVFVDYAHTDDALSNVIRALRQVSPGKIIVVFGCGGERDKVKRPKMGRVVTESADYAFITSDNPRSEGPLEIIKEIQAGVEKNNYRIIPDRKEAIKAALSMAVKGDVVLIAGKGHERYQIIGNKMLEFDDREAAKQCLESMNL